MEFIFETAYDQKAITTMVKALRKSVRKKRSRRSYILGTIVIMFALWLSLPFGNEAFVIDFRTVVTWMVVAILIFTLIFQDSINGYIARKRMLPGLAKAIVTFKEEGYHSETEVGSSDFKYETIQLLVETEEYLVFVFGQNHAQIYDKKSLTGGTMEEFREFIKNVTGKAIQYI